MCIACHETLLARRSVRSLALLSVGAVAGGTMVAAGGPSSGNVVFGVSLAGLFISAQLFPHEIAHALVGRFAGLRVLAVSFGSGPELLHRRIGSTDWVVRAIPLRGYTNFAPARADRFAAAFVLAVAAGPGVSVVLATIAFIWDPGASVALGTVRLALVGSALFMAASNLWPTPAGGPTRSDGRWLIDLLTRGEAEERAVTALLVADGAISDATRSGEPVQIDDDARTTLHTMLADGDTRAFLPLWHLLFLDRRYDEAADLLRRRLQELPEPDLARAIAVNVLAWTLVAASEVSPGGEADRSSAEAFELLPDEAAVQGTRGSVLIELGSTEAGLDLLDRSLSGSLSREQRASTEAYLAIGAADLGLLSRAERHLQTAERLDPNDMFLPRARRRLAAATDRATNPTPPAA